MIYINLRMNLEIVRSSFVVRLVQTPARRFELLRTDSRSIGKMFAGHGMAELPAAEVTQRPEITSAGVCSKRFLGANRRNAAQRWKMIEGWNWL